nr:hypothetical protein TgIa.0260 [Toxoplasma gondii RH]
MDPSSSSFSPVNSSSSVSSSLPSSSSSSSLPSAVPSALSSSSPSFSSIVSSSSSAFTASSPLDSLDPEYLFRGLESVVTSADVSTLVGVLRRALYCRRSSPECSRSPRPSAGTSAALWKAKIRPWLFAVSAPCPCLLEHDRLAMEDEGGACGAHLKKGDIGFRCLDCEHDSTCVVCGKQSRNRGADAKKPHEPKAAARQTVELDTVLQLYASIDVHTPCFLNADHASHNYMIIQASGGCCDCGDPSSWAPAGFCSKHRGVTPEMDGPASTQSLPAFLRLRSQQHISACVAFVTQRLRELPRETLWRSASRRHLQESLADVLLSAQRELELFHRQQRELEAQRLEETHGETAASTSADGPSSRTQSRTHSRREEGEEDEGDGEDDEGDGEEEEGDGGEGDGRVDVETDGLGVPWRRRHLRPHTPERAEGRARDAGINAALLREETLSNPFDFQLWGEALHLTPEEVAALTVAAVAGRGYDEQSAIDAGARAAMAAIRARETHSTVSISRSSSSFLDSFSSNSSSSASSGTPSSGAAAAASRGASGSAAGARGDGAPRREGDTWSPSSRWWGGEDEGEGADRGGDSRLLDPSFSASSPVGTASGSAPVPSGLPTSALSYASTMSLFFLDRLVASAASPGDETRDESEGDSRSASAFASAGLADLLDLRGRQRGLSPRGPQASGDRRERNERRSERRGERSERRRGERTGRADREFLTPTGRTSAEDSALSAAEASRATLVLTQAVVSWLSELATKHLGYRWLVTSSLVPSALVRWLCEHGTFGASLQRQLHDFYMALFASPKFKTKFAGLILDHYTHVARGVPLTDDDSRRDADAESCDLGSLTVQLFTVPNLAETAVWEKDFVARGISLLKEAPMMSSAHEVEIMLSGLEYVNPKLK